METAVDSTINSTPGPEGRDDAVQTGQTWIEGLGRTNRDDDFSKERGVSVECSRQSASETVSLHLKHLRNRCLRRWNKDTERTESADLDLMKVPTPDVGSPCKDSEIRQIYEMAREDILEVWQAAVELENEVALLHEELEQCRCYQEEFEEEKAAQQGQIRELQSKMEQVQMFWKGKLKGAEHELNEQERRLLLAPTEDGSKLFYNEQRGQSELEERSTEMYNELMRANEELARSQAERSSMKSELAALKAQLRQRTGSADELASLTKKYETLKTRSLNLQSKLSQAEESIEALTENLMEAEAKNQEYEVIMEEHKCRQGELTRHLEALRKVNSTLVPDNAANMSQTYDLFAELQRAQGNQTQAGTTSGLVNTLGNTGQNVTVQHTAGDLATISEDPTRDQKSDMGIMDSLNTAKVITTADGGIHIHLHQHFHSHAHRHHHQHDHIHQLTGHTEEFSGGKTQVRKEVARVHDLIRKGKIVPVDAARIAKTQKAPDSPADVNSQEEHLKAMSGVVDGSESINRKAEEDPDFNVIERSAEDFKDFIPQPKTKTFTYATTKLKGRTSHHVGPKNENLATVFVDSMQQHSSNLKSDDAVEAS